MHFDGQFVAERQLHGSLPLVRGYTLNRQRFEHNARELEAALTLVRKAAAGEALSTDQGRGLIDVIARYTQTFLLLQRYDEGLLVEPMGIAGGVLPAVGEARSAVAPEFDS